MANQIKIRIDRIVCLAVLLCALLLSGCETQQPVSVQPDFNLPEAFSVDGSRPLPEQWWQAFNDPHLNAVIDEAIQNNFTIRSAWDRLTQSEQIAIKAGAAKLPSLSYGDDVAWTGRRVSGNQTDSTGYSAGLSAAYEVDLWGRIQSNRQAAVLDTLAAQESVTAAAMTLSATITKTWYQLAEARQQEQIILKQIETNQKILDVIKVQFREGQAGAAEVFNQEELVQSGYGQLIQVRGTSELLEHQLQVLMGQTPGPWSLQEPINLMPLGELPVIDIPAVVIQRRPDVKRAYLNVQAADVRMAAAIADQYPTIRLSAAAQTTAEPVTEIFDHWLANLAASVAGPLFDAGLRKAEVQRTRAVVSERLNDFSQLVLVALQETEDAVSREQNQRQYVENLQTQLALAKQVYERTYQNYVKGQVDYIRVLTALVTMQRLEQNELTARRVLIERRVDLCRSIAGGWPLERPGTTELPYQQPLSSEKE